MAGKHTKTEDFVDELSVTLQEKGFNRVGPQGIEVARYERSGSSIGFQVGIEREDDSEEEPEFNHIFLVTGYNLPERIFGPQGERIFPNALMSDFFRDTSIFHQSLTVGENEYRDGRMNLVYHIGFEKDKTNREEMTAVLVEVVDYFCDYITRNVEMRTRINSLVGKGVISPREMRGSFS